MALQDTLMFFLEGHDNKKKIDTINKKLDGFIDNQIIINNNIGWEIINTNNFIYLAKNSNNTNPFSYTNDTNKYHLVFFELQPSESNYKASFTTLRNTEEQIDNFIYRYFIQYKFTNIIDNSTEVINVLKTQIFKFEMDRDIPFNDNIPSLKILLHTLVPPMSIFSVGLNRLNDSHAFVENLYNLFAITNLPEVQYA